MNDSLLVPGTIVKGRTNETLVLWKTYKCSIYDEAGKVDANEIMVILEAKQNKSKQKAKARMTEEWQRGAYLVLSSNGVKGWLGEGWVIPVN